MGRTPYPERLFSMTEMPGCLRLFGRESLGSWYDQALVARRQQHFSFRAETGLRFSPVNIQQAAGLIHYYNRHKFHFLGLTFEESVGTVLTILSCPGDWPDGRLSFPRVERHAVAHGGTTVELAAEVDGPALQFSANTGKGWNLVGPILDASVISDEGGRGEHGSFTGAFIGMAAFDTSGGGLPADFAYFSYAGRDG